MQPLVCRSPWRSALPGGNGRGGEARGTRCWKSSTKELAYGAPRVTPGVAVFTMV